MAIIRGGDPQAAIPPLGEALRIMESLDEPWWTESARAALGDALVDVGRVEEGLRALRTSLRFYADGERDLSGVRFSLDFISRGLVAAGDPETALVLAGGAEALGERLGLQAPPAIVGEWDARAAAAATLPPEVVARRWEEGRAMGLAELVSRACAAGAGCLSEPAGS